MLSADQKMRPPPTTGYTRPHAMLMSSPVTTVGPDTPVARLVELMTDLGLRHLPVVDDEGRLAGIVTRTELIAVLHRALVGP